MERSIIFLKQLLDLFPKKGDGWFHKYLMDERLIEHGVDKDVCGEVTSEPVNVSTLKEDFEELEMHADCEPSCPMKVRFATKSEKQMG